MANKKKYSFWSNMRGARLYCWAYSKKQAVMYIRSQIQIKTGSWDNNLNTLNIEEVK